MPHKNNVEKTPENIPTPHLSKERNTNMIQVTNSGDTESVEKQEIPSKRSEKYAGMIKDVTTLIEREGSISETRYIKDHKECICKRAVSQHVLEEAIKTVTGHTDYRTVEKDLNELVFSGQFVKISKSLFEVK